MDTKFQKQAKKKRSSKRNDIDEEENVSSDESERSLWSLVIWKKIDFEISSSNKTGVI